MAKPVERTNLSEGAENIYENQDVAGLTQGPGLRLWVK